MSIDEIRQNFVFAHRFTGHYAMTVTMSNGAKRHIELTPMVHDGAQVVELRDNDGRTYMGLDGTTTDGKLMIQVRSVADLDAEMKAEGWPTGTRP